MVQTLNLTERYRSGQTGQTVNLLAYAFEGSNPSLSTIIRTRLAFHSAIFFKHNFGMQKNIRHQLLRFTSTVEVKFDRWS